MGAKRAFVARKQAVIMLSLFFPEGSDLELSGKGTGRPLIRSPQLSRTDSHRLHPPSVPY